MRTNSTTATRDTIRAAMQQAIVGGDNAAYVQAFDDMCSLVARETKQQFDDAVAEVRNQADAVALAQRGHRCLTAAEQLYYNGIIAAMQSDNPRQALTDANLTIPTTVVNDVFDNLRKSHPLLSAINFRATSGAVKTLMDVGGHQEAKWGELSDADIKEISGGFAVVDTMLLKLSAMLPVCKAELDLGAEWLDTYVRDCLYEALANGLEAGIVNGDGNGKPIGMTKQVGAGVSVVGGAYPDKPTVKVNDLGAKTVGNVLAMLSIDGNGRERDLTNVIMVVNPFDYYSKIYPATTMMAPDGSYRSTMPYDIKIIQSRACPRSKAVIGIADRYFAAAGMAQGGKIEYDDSCRFDEDKRLYRIKTYATGMPKDGNAFAVLDISSLAPATYHTTVIDERTPSTDATLSGLKIGGLALSPAFAAATTTYTAATKSATNTVVATPADAGASVVVKVGGKAIDNGTAATWASGSNTVTVIVTAEDGSTTKTYTVTVTKS